MTVFSLLHTFMMSVKPNVIFVLGAPGSGKGTQCKRLVDAYGYVHISAGDLLRREQACPDSKYGKLIAAYIKEGKIVPVEITCNLLKFTIDKSGQNQFLIDGFPRNQNNLIGWNSSMADQVNLNFVLYFDCPESLCVERCLDRGAAGSGRSDDNVDSLKKRFKVFLTETKPIVQLFEQKKLLRIIDASKSPDEVFELVKQVFQKDQSK